MYADEPVCAARMSRAMTNASQDRPRTLACCWHKKTDCKKVTPFLTIMRSSQRKL